MPPAKATITDKEMESLRVTIREYIDLKFKLLEENIRKSKVESDGDLRVAKTEMKALELKIEASDKVTDTRLSGMNQWHTTVTEILEQTRATIEELKDTFLTKSEYEAKHERIMADIKDLNEFKLTMKAKADQKTLIIGLVVLTITTAITIASFIMSLADWFVGK